MRTMSMAAIGAALAASIALASPASGSEFGKVTPLAGWTMLETGTTIVPVRLTRKDRPAGSARAELEIVGLDYDAPPRVLYQVSLQARDGRRAPVGLINFYNETAPGYAATGIPVRVLDATEALRRLGGEANGLVFEATSGLRGLNPETRADSAARVRFFSAAIRWH